MTEIFIDMRQLSGVEPSGALTTTRGRFLIYPYSLLYRDDYFVTKKKLRLTVDGTGSVFLPPTSTNEGMVFEPLDVPGLALKVFAIPDSVSAVNFVDLVELDPSTLDPTTDNVAAWDAALADFDTRLTAAETTLSGLGTLSTVDDAPSDGTLYARQDGAWEAVSVELAADNELLIWQGI